MVDMVTFEGDTYEEVRQSFEWDLSGEYNIAVDCVGKHPPDTVALYQAYADGTQVAITFGDLDRWSDRLAAALRDHGVGRGDRVAIALPQRPATVVSHLACWKLGAISVPLSVLYGERALTHRLVDSGAVVAIVDPAVREAVVGVRPDCPTLDVLVDAGPATPAILPRESDPVRETKAADSVSSTEGRSLGTEQSFEQEAGNRADTTLRTLLQAADGPFTPTTTTASDPALIIYTSGTTGDPKGVVHRQGVWRSYCPGFRMYFEQVDDVPQGVYWTPSDWAWIGGLGTVLFPAWHYGQPVVGGPRESFSARTTYERLERFGVTHASLPPTALRMLADTAETPDAYDLDLEVIVSGSEPLPTEMVRWVERVFEDVVVNEGYGQTEVGNVVSNCRSWFDLEPGSMGKPIPGYDVRFTDPASGSPVEPGDVGEICVRRDDNPGVFVRYWDEGTDSTNPHGSHGDGSEDEQWHRTGDLARSDDDGYVRFVSRVDDLIVTSGYRVAPQEIEAVLRGHDDVAAVGVTGLPDERRGIVIAAAVVLEDGVSPSAELRSDLIDRVRTVHAAYAYPRVLRFVDALPLTSTQKVNRRALEGLFDYDGEPSEGIER